MIQYTIPTRVLLVREHSHQKWVSGLGKETIYESVSDGWFVLLAGSREWLYLGDTKPSLKENDEVEITIRKKSCPASMPTNPPA